MNVNQYALGIAQCISLCQSVSKSDIVIHSPRICTFTFIPQCFDFFCIHTCRSHEAHVLICHGYGAETNPTIPAEKGKLDTRLHTWTLIESVGSIKIKNRSWSFSCPNALIPHGFCHIPSKVNDLFSHLLQGGINCFCSQEGRHCICFPWCLKLRCRDQLTTLQIHIALRKKKTLKSGQSLARSSVWIPIQFPLYLTTLTEFSLHRRTDNLCETQ